MSTDRAKAHAQRLAGKPSLSRHSQSGLCNNSHVRHNPWEIRSVSKQRHSQKLLLVCLPTLQNPLDHTAKNTWLSSSPTAHHISRFIAAANMCGGQQMDSLSDHPTLSSHLMHCVPFPTTFLQNVAAKCKRQHHNGGQNYWILRLLLCPAPSAPCFADLDTPLSPQHKISVQVQVLNLLKHASVLHCHWHQPAQCSICCLCHHGALWQTPVQAWAVPQT